MTSQPARRHKRDAQLQRAVAAYERRDYASAEAICRKLVRDDGSDVDALHLCGLARDAQGDPAQAEAFIGRALAVRPGFAAAWSNLGNILAAASRDAEARRAYEKACAADPGFAPARHNLARLLLRAGDHAGALAAVREACRLQPGEAASWLLQGEIAAARGDLAAAEAALRHAAALAPGAAAPRTNLGNLLQTSGRPDEAIAAHRAATRAQPGSAAAWYGLAAAQRAAGLVEDSLASADAALQRDSAMAEAWNLRGAGLRAMGRFDEAVASFEAAIARRPGFAQAIRNIAISRAHRDGSEAERLRALLHGGTLGEEDAISTGFALAKVLDDLERCDEAFAAAQEANARVARRLAQAGQAYDPAGFRAAVRDALVPGRDGEPVPDSDAAVLVVGMPRSGTTLVEQILASHPRVTGAGELPDLSRLWAAGGEVARPYLARLGQKAAPGAIRVVDKMPDNILLVRKVAALLPAARVVLCRRDPRDTALSCFMTRFSAGNAFSYDLWSCGHRSGITHRLGEELAKLLPLAHLTVDYETLVDDVEGEARRLVAFLGLDWDRRCLEFHRTERPVLTASAWQVRQPVFTSSVGRWRRYRDHIDPLLDGLAAADEARHAGAASGEPTPSS